MHSSSSTMIRTCLTAAAMASLFLAAGAQAQTTGYKIPHTDNNVYLLQSPGGLCAVAQIVAGNTTNDVTRAVCDPGADAQKFYVLDSGHDEDAKLPFTGTAPVRVNIVSAPSFDLAFTPAFWGLTTDPAGSHQVSLKQYRTQQLDRAPVYKLTRPAFSGPYWRTASSDGEPFVVTGRRTLAYGANGKYVTKTVDGSTLPGSKATCNVAFFGSDPIVGTPKACYVHEDVNPVPPLQLFLKTDDTGYCIVPDSGNSYEGQACPAQPATWMLWTLLPVSGYPK